jgi:hypothetical protein
VNGSNWLLVDGGSIYVLGPQPNSWMESNYISNQQHLYGALYTDEVRCAKCAVLPGHSRALAYAG